MLTVFVNIVESVWVRPKIDFDEYILPIAGFEPAQIAPPPPEDGVSTNFTISAINNCSRSPGGGIFKVYYAPFRKLIL